MLDLADLIVLLAIIAVPSTGTSNSVEASQPPMAPPQPIARPVTRTPSRFTPFAVASTIFDSNINHDAADIDDYGGVVGIGGTYRNDPRKPTLEVQYQAGLHHYANTSQWNRLSHYGRVAWDRRLNKRLALQAVGEGSIKGSTEDRELSNQALLSPRLEFRFIPALRVRAFGGWRVKRYEDTPDRNAFNRYLGLELVGRPRSGTRWDVGGKYELNAAESPRQRYLRWTWYAGLSKPFTRSDRLEMAMAYRRQRYPYRLIDVKGGPDVPRRDWRVEPEISLLHTVHENMDLRLGYGFNRRESNDPRRDYRSHEALFSVLRRW